MKRTWIYFAALIMLMADCEPENEPLQTDSDVRISFMFAHTLDGTPLEFDTLKYVNEAGNPYLINEIQYFISDVILYKSDGDEKLIGDWKDKHYVDTDLPSTQLWEVYDEIDPGTYDSIAFTFGINEEKNLSYMYVNPPEKDMFWPEVLGGGYHYMKLNGKWLPEGQTLQTSPFDFHLGIGQEYYSYPDSITAFIHNHFRVSLPNSGFTITAGEQLIFELGMQVENWFRSPNVYDHDIYGGYIMQNQEAMAKVKSNGHDVFTIRKYAE